MTKDDRIYELEQQLERVLDLFDDQQGDYYIEVDITTYRDAYSSGNSDSDPVDFVRINPINDVILEEAIEVLYGQDDQADGSY